MLHLSARISNFIYFAKRRIRTYLHKMFPSLHKLYWVGVFECGCCGFEGVSCRTCDLVMVIGECADFGTESYAGGRRENGD